MVPQQLSLGALVLGVFAGSAHHAMVYTAQAQVVISQVYGGGGASTGSPSYKNDFIELFNRGTEVFDLAGHSVQYASSTGSSWSVTQLSGLLQPGQHFLVQESGGSAGNPLPTPDTIGTFAMSAVNGKVAFVASTAALTGVCPVGPPILDLVGYGNAGCYEGSGAVPALSTILSALRSLDGCVDTDNNAADFVTGTPMPRNRGTPAVTCGPVPIKLSYFGGALNVSGNRVDLEWGTESEINNFGFEVEKKLVQAPAFELVANSFVAGHGTTLEPQYYVYSDTVISVGTWYYRLVQIDLDGTRHHSSAIQIAVVTGVLEDVRPQRFVLLRNYPNPFNPTTNIQFSVVNRQLTILKVYDVLGREVSTLVNEVKEPGTYTVQFDGSYLASGVYVYRLSAGDFLATRKVILMK